MDPSISEIKYLGGATIDFVEVRIPDNYPDPENLVLVIYDLSHDGSMSATPSAADMYLIESDGSTASDTDDDGFTHYIIGSAYNGDAIALHMNDAIGLYNSATGETYGLYSFGNPYTVSEGALMPDGVTADPFAGAPAQVLTASTTQGDSIVENEDGSYTGTDTPTPGSSFVCFTDGAEILTPNGPVFVEELNIGDLVVIKDGDPKPILWIGRRWFSESDAVCDDLLPVRIKKNALGENNPRRDLLVSPNHAVLIEDPIAELYFEDTEVLVPVKHLLGQPGVEQCDRRSFGYFHILLDRHELVKANGLWSESLFLGEVSLSNLGQTARDEVFEIFPDLNKDGHFAPKTCRKVLRKYEVKSLEKSIF